MPNVIKPKRSYTASTVPTGLVAGEIAVNATDGKIWLCNAAGTANVLVSSLLLSDMVGSTTNITEGTKLFYTDSRSRAAVSAGSGITYSSATGVIAADSASANTASKLVIRDASGNFSAGTITASLTGNATTVTTNANLTGVITSVGNTTSIASQTGTGSKFVVDTSPVIITPTTTGLNETKTAPAISAGVLALNCALGNVFAVSLNAAITSITFSNIPASNTAYGLTLAFTMDGTARAVTWPAAVKWSGGTAPTLTSTLNKVDIFVLTTWDGGTNWYAMTGGQNF